jgi:hypothetical protein
LQHLTWSTTDTGAPIAGELRTGLGMQGGE